MSTRKPIIWPLSSTSCEKISRTLKFGRLNTLKMSSGVGMSTEKEQFKLLSFTESLFYWSSLTKMTLKSCLKNLPNSKDQNARTLHTFPKRQMRRESLKIMDTLPNGILMKCLTLNTSWSWTTLQAGLMLIQLNTQSCPGF